MLRIKESSIVYGDTVNTALYANYKQVRPSSGTTVHIYVYPHMPTYVHTPRDIARTAHL